MTSRRQEPEPEDLLAHASWLTRLARRLVDDAVGAEDLAQDAWVVALERPGRTAPDAEVREPRRFLAGVLRRLASDDRRRSRARSVRERRSARETATRSAAPAAADVVARAEAQRGLVDSVLALGEPYKSTVLRHWFDGASAETIAREQRVPSSTVRTRLARALELLRTELAAATEKREGTSWQAALLPLAAVPDRALASTLSSTGPLFLSTLAMSTSLKLAAVFGAITFGFFAWTYGVDPLTISAIESAGSSRSTPGPEAPEAPGSLAERAVVAEGAAPPVAGVRQEPAQEAEPLEVAPSIGTLEVLVLENDAPVARGWLHVGPKRFTWLPRDPWNDEIEALHVPLGADGTARIANLEPGERYAFGIETAPQTLHQQHVTLPEPEGARVVIQLGSARVFGHVFASDGRPIDGARVQTYSKAMEHSTTSFTDDDGRYELEGLCAETYRIGLYRDGGWNTQGPDESRTVTLDPQRALELDFGRPTALPEWSGTLRDARGEPVPNYGAPGTTGEIWIEDLERGGRTRHGFGLDGSFTIALEPGHYSASANAPSTREQKVLAAEVVVGEAGVVLDLVLPGTTFAGRLIDARTGDTVASARRRAHQVGLLNEAESRAMYGATVQPDGSFVLAGIEPGVYVVTTYPLESVERVVIEVREGAAEVARDLTVDIPHR